MIVSAALGVACQSTHAPSPLAGGPEPSASIGPGAPAPRAPARAHPELVAALHPQDAEDPQDADGAEDTSWSVRYRFPLVLGYTDFQPLEGEALKSLTTLALVPRVEFIRPLDENWTLIPFVGVGGGWLVDDEVAILILTSGVRAEWVRRYDEVSELRIVPRIRYDANLNEPDGFLGDWGRLDLSVELRRALGGPGDRLRVEPGIYALGYWFWDDIDFDVPGLAPKSIDDQFEFGISLGTRDPIKVFGFKLPRVYIGLRSGDQADTVSIRFGEI